MRLLVANFDAQSIVTREEVIEHVLALPFTHISGIQVVRYDPNRLIATTLGYVTEQPTLVSSHGLFYHDRETAVIVLFKFRDRTEFRHVLFHEVGHYVFLRKLWQEQRDAWMYRVRKDEPRVVTSYAAKNAREDFAETYAFWCTRNEELRRFPVRYRFFETEVFTS